jgi:hypothetical protein
MRADHDPPYELYRIARTIPPDQLLGNGRFSIVILKYENLSGGSAMAEQDHQKRVAEFLAELTKAIKAHSARRTFDSSLYQFLVIGAAIAGFASLVAGLLYQSAIGAGIIGALTSVATILSQQLHCVKAVDWHNRMAVELDVIRRRLLYEHQSAPNELELAELSKQLTDLQLKMTDAWEKVTSIQPTALGDLHLHSAGKRSPS